MQYCCSFTEISWIVYFSHFSLLWFSILTAFHPTRCTLCPLLIAGQTSMWKPWHDYYLLSSVRVHSRRLAVPGSVEPLVCVSLSRVMKHIGFQSVSRREQWCIDWCQWVGERVSEIPSHVQHCVICLRCVYVFVDGRSQNWPVETCLMRIRHMAIFNNMSW